MLSIQCPHCNAALKLKQAPPAGKVKCPKCSNVIPVGAASPRPVAATQPAAQLDPDDEGFDFGRISFPTASPVAAVSHFPVDGGQLAVYDGPIPGDPLEAVPAEDENPDPDAGGPAAAPAKKSSGPALIVGVLAFLLTFVISAVAAFVIFCGGGSKEKKVDLLAELRATAPADYQAVSHQGCVTLVPKGVDINELPSLIGDSSTVVESAASGGIFFFGAMDGGTREIDDEQMRKKAGRQLGGDFLGGTPTERNGYKGIKGKLDGSLFLPNMMVEAYHVDGRFVILGCAPASFEAQPDVQMSVDRELEREEMDNFYKFFKIGPKPSGWFF